MSRSVKRKRGGNAITRQVHHCNVMALALRLAKNSKAPKDNISLMSNAMQ